jgi:hypothetical protein
VKPAEGRWSPDGGENLKAWPFGRGMLSVMGLKDSFPENAMAVTVVGDARKFMVFRFPSLRALKFRLKEVTIAVWMVSLCARPKF